MQFQHQGHIADLKQQPKPPEKAGRFQLSPAVQDFFPGVTYFSDSKCMILYILKMVVDIRPAVGHELVFPVENLEDVDQTGIQGALEKAHVPHIALPVRAFQSRPDPRVSAVKELIHEFSEVCLAQVPELEVLHHLLRNFIFRILQLVFQGFKEFRKSA
ncbi:MAG: hypothetical protein BWY49_00210 [Candidatus Omnitrophica bacterium ADurb.Bin314]|nr:MAG: hypothetical protein BWY49_00210 [Candidatus Omnitrophica bacterium ADurb.Bin314]